MAKKPSVVLTWEQLLQLLRSRLVVIGDSEVRLPVEALTEDRQTIQQIQEEVNSLLVACDDDENLDDDEDLYEDNDDEEEEEDDEDDEEQES